MALIPQNLVSRAGDTMTGALNLGRHGLLAQMPAIVTVNAGGGADATTIDAGITAANALSPGSGNPVAIIVYPGSYTSTSNVTVPAWVSIVGLVPGAATWTTVQGRGPVVTFQGNQNITNINFNVWAGTWYFGLVTGSGTVFRNCTMAAPGSGQTSAGYTYVLRCQMPQNPSIQLIDCTLSGTTDVSGGAGTTYGLWIPDYSGSGVLVNIQNCEISATNGQTSNYAIWTQNNVYGTIYQWISSAFIGTVSTSGAIGYNCAVTGSNSGLSLNDNLLRNAQTNTSSGTALQPSAAAGVPLLLKGAASQSGNLTEWRNSSNTLLSSVDSAGNLALATGQKLKVGTGTNASAGTATLVGGTVTVATTAVTASSLILVTPTSTGANSGVLAVTAQAAGTSFTVTSTNVLDTSTFSWMIVN